MQERVQRLAEQAQPLDWKGQPSLIGLRPGGLYLLLYREEEYEALARRIPVWPVDPRGYHSNIAEVGMLIKVTRHHHPVRDDDAPQHD
jgi:hypothetical protein